MVRIHDLLQCKLAGKPITMVTCYDAWSAKLLGDQDVDCILVGDSLAMVMHGFESTLAATPAMMAMHTEAVARGLSGAKNMPLLIADMPFMSYRQGLVPAVKAATKLMRAGAHAIKLEGAKGNEDLIRHLVDSGIPVMGHLGLTPQSVHQLGGHCLQAKDDVAAQRLLQEARDLQKAGCFALVLECVPETLARNVSQDLQIPVIGIGAGRYVDGQVLVLHDLLGFSKDFKPRFLAQFAQGEDFFQQGIADYCQAVRSKVFPSREHSYRPVADDNVDTDEVDDVAAEEAAG